LVVEGELADELAGLLVDDADVLVGDEELDGAVLVGSAAADVVWSAVVAEGHFAFGVDLVLADAEVGLGECCGVRGSGLDPGAVCL
jgi:hypothetical protein